MPAILKARDDTVVRYNIKRVHDVLSTLEGKFAKKPRLSADVRTATTFVEDVLRINANIVTELRAGADDMRRSKAKVSATETVALQPTFMGNDRLNSDVANGWIDVKRLVSTAKMESRVLDSLIAAQREFNNFGDALIVSLPSISQSFGASIKARFNNNLDRAVREYRR